MTGSTYTGSTVIVDENSLVQLPSLLAAAPCVHVLHVSMLAWLLSECPTESCA